jgi:hypothetical protein
MNDKGQYIFTANCGRDRITGNEDDVKHCARCGNTLRACPYRRHILPQPGCGLDW